MHPLTTISPIDGRYINALSELGPFFSEMALMRYRLLVEIEYLIALSREHHIPQLPEFSVSKKEWLRSIYRDFSLGDAQRVKTIEETTNHDVKAIEYFMKEKLSNTDVAEFGEFIHFALTSEDVNNLAYSLMWRDALYQVYLPAIRHVQDCLLAFARDHKDDPMLSLTHGQSATPTTVGKEFAVFATRIKRQLQTLDEHKLQGKFGGATGTWGAHHVAYPDVEWLRFSERFICSLGLEPNLCTIQIESHDSLAENYHNIERINSILIDFCRDVWMYVSREILVQKPKEDEIGSSTMPHKINPIQFENAEGNLGIANAYFRHLTAKLPISRMQRDLSDSTVLRNQGVPLAHSLLACKNILKGMGRLSVNKAKLIEELEERWEVLAEPIQTILRKHKYEHAYEKLKELTRGKKITKEMIREFVEELDIPQEEKEKLLSLTPQSYRGLAATLVDKL